MRKNLRILVMLVLLMIVLPIAVNAESIELGSQAVCQTSGNQKTGCHFNVYITNPSNTEYTFVFTPAGGATINASDINLDSGAELDWEIANRQTLASGAIEVTVRSADGSPKEWNDNLFNYSYTDSGTIDCKVSYSLKSADTTPTTPDEPEKEPEKNPQTGSTLPYIALGAIVLVATGAYLATKNKSKMYKL